MPPTPHHDVHPIRRTIALLLLLAAVIALLAAGWNQNHLADSIETSVRGWMEAGGYFPNIVHWQEMPRGGHFAAFEQPQLFVDNLRAWARVVDA